MEILSMDPASPDTLKGGDQIQLKIQYQAPSGRSVRIWAMADATGTFYAPSGDLKGRGTVDRFVGSERPNQVKRIRVEMVDDETRETLLEIEKDVDFTWEGWAEGAKPLVTQNQPFPPLAVIDLNGKEVDISKLKGKVVLIDFWATWCGPCLAEIPHLLEAYKKHHSQGFEIIGISLDKDQNTLRRYIEKQGMTWPQHLDEDKSVRKRSGVHGIPSMYLLDRKGVVRHIDVRGESLEKAIAELCSEP